MLGVEDREAQRLVALEQEVARAVAQPGELRADALRGGEAVEVALGGLLRQLAAEAAGSHRAVAQRLGRRAAEAPAQARPVRRQVAGGGVQLAQGAVLGGVEAQRYRPGSHSGSSPALAPRERMKSRSERRLR